MVITCMGACTLSIFISNFFVCIYNSMWSTNKVVVVVGVPPTSLIVQVTCQANSAFVNSGKQLFTYSAFAVTNVSIIFALWQTYMARLSRFNPTSPTLFVVLC